ncbi:hypothetical protein L207DRAFT_583301 [Hyaloscypha variabilis F]|uniref:Cora-domain-containing protein n=1 Tax=Hyaloscypha variabilis (strain UAMH 11265 / GT02V1 / F) TaxID=1149755 RepID=A0A2J6RLN1_HYAVF|nr:hypothetical protein L207DRAFT_583301 [Hyaloscypha variabilis F]
MKLVERRYSLMLKMFLGGSAYGQYSLISVVDDFMDDVRTIKEFDNPLECKNENESGGFSKHDLLPVGEFTGLMIFQIRICQFILRWESDWMNTLDSLDRMVSVKLGDVSNEDLRQKLMYDSHDLPRSKLYFEVLQVLRIFSESIEQNFKHLEELPGRVSFETGGYFDHWIDTERNPRFQEVLPKVQEVLSFNWAKVTTILNSSTERLRTRLDRKTEEVKGLRDGIFNAQSVREATRGTEINQYLLVFTVVTILYLPPTFVATFWGMHLFDVNNDINGTRKQFWTTIGAVSTLTYIVAIVALTGISRREKLKEFVSQTWHWLISHSAKGVLNLDDGTTALGTVHINEKKVAKNIFQKLKLRRSKKDLEKGKQPEATTGNILG